MKYLIADLASENELKLLLINRGATSQILNAYYYAFNSSENLAGLLSARLKENRLSEYPLQIVLPAKMVKDTVLHLPKLSIKELKKVIPREISTFTGQKSDYLFGFSIGQIIQEKQTARQEVTVFFAEQEQIVKFLEELKSYDIKPDRLLVANEVLLSMVAKFPLPFAENEALALMEIKSQKIAITILKGRSWSVSREFQYRSDPNAQLENEALGRIILEANRTFQFFRQKNRTSILSRVILFGSNMRDELAKFLGENLGLTIVCLDNTMLQKLLLPPTVEDSAEFLSIFAPSIGAYYLLQKKGYSNFLPTEFTEKEVLPRRIIGWVISSAILMGIILPVVFYLENIKADKKTELAHLQQSFASIDANLQEIGSTKQLRAEYYRKSFFYYFGADSALRIADFIRQLTFLTDEEVKLLALDLKNGYNKIVFQLNAEIRNVDNVQAQKKFLHFLEKMAQLPGVSNLTYSDLKSVTESDIPQEQIAEKNIVPLSFSIRGNLERQ